MFLAMGEAIRCLAFMLIHNAQLLIASYLKTHFSICYIYHMGSLSGTISEPQESQYNAWRLMRHVIPNSKPNFQILYFVSIQCKKVLLKAVQCCTLRVLHIV